MLPFKVFLNQGIKPTTLTPVYLSLLHFPLFPYISFSLNELIIGGDNPCLIILIWEGRCFVYVSSTRKDPGNIKLKDLY